jgi:3-oxoacyl-[acyl-carrier protein] reductase
MGLGGRIALVTGGCQGLGRGIALELARRGARIVVSYLEPGPPVRETLDALAKLGSPAMALCCDVRRQGQVRAMIREARAAFGAPEILINNAGIGSWGSLLDCTEEAWDAMLDTNVKGAFLCARETAPDMVANGWGRIVNITSTGSIRVIRGMGAYCVSKASLAMLTQALAAELGQHGITVNAVGPSTVPTALNATALARPGVLEAERHANPTGRIGTPLDIAAAVAFLASDAASWINGQNLMVDGGLTILSPQPDYDPLRS